MKRKLKTARPLFPGRDELLRNIASVLEEGWLMNGNHSRRFEEDFSRFIGVPHAVSVNSCTTALEIVLKYIGVEGGEVIVPTNTFLASANAVLFAGGQPVLADIKEKNYFLDPGEVERLANGRTRAVIVVHIGGLIPPVIEELLSICKEKNIVLIEDCAHAAGAAYKGRKAGSFGFAGCFSFYPTKIMTTGTGGMITTSDAKLVDFAKSMRLHGAGQGLADITNIGNDWFLDEIRSCLGLNQLKHIGEFIAKRREAAARYDRNLAGCELLEIFPVSPLSYHAYYKYPVQIHESIDTADLKAIFPEKYGFELESIYWPTCHLQPVYKRKFGYEPGLFPVAEKILSRQVTLPLHPEITKDDVDFVSECLLQELKERTEAQ